MPLYIVATPIGNLRDLSERARDVLSSVDWVAAEDTRRARTLLLHAGSHVRCISCHQHNEAARAVELVARLQAGESGALISDAGTPLIRDPGGRLVAAAREAGIVVVPIPGPSAVLAALSVCAFAVDRFAFEGFLPARGAVRRSALQALVDEPRALVFFEAPHRIVEMIADLLACFGPDRLVLVGRELTKLHEQTVQAPLAQLAAMLADGSIPVRGEFVVVVAGRGEVPTPPVGDLGPLIDALAGEVAPSRLAAILAAWSGMPRAELYARITGRK